MVEKIAISELIPNPINLEIYGEVDSGLSEDIKQNGIIEPIVINQDKKIISGHRRYKGAQVAGLEYVPFIQIYTKDEFDEERQIVSRNKYRYKTARQIWNEYKSLEKDDLLYDGKRGVREGTVDNYAATIGVSKGTLHRIKMIFSEAEKGDPYAIVLAFKLETKEDNMTPGQAYKKLLAKQNERRYKSIVNDTTKGICDDQIYCGDFKDVLEDNIPDGSVSLVLTDPPYPKEYIPLFGDIARFAEKKLCDGGYLVCYSGQMYLPEVMRELCSTQNLKYYWTFCLSHEGSSQLIMTTNVQCGWKPVIVLQKCKEGERPIKLISEKTPSDVIKSEVREKTDHAWQQSLSGVSKLMELFSKEGDLVIDTCVGAGTTAVAAKKLKRRFVGAEIEERFANAAKNRLAETVE